MSGGSYNYAYRIYGLDDAVKNRNNLKAIGERLAGLDEKDFPGAKAAGRRTLRLVSLIDVWEEHALAQAELMGEVWKAVEWWDSYDYGPEQVAEALNKLLETKT